MISVCLVGRVVDRPFRPGNGARVVIRIDAEDGSGRTQHLEVDAFAETGDWAMNNARVGETLAVTGRLESRVYKDKGEEVEELRIVAARFEPVHIGPRSDSSHRRNRFRHDGDGALDPNAVDPNAIDPNVVESVATSS